MTEERFEATDALMVLKNHGIITAYRALTHNRKRYYDITWAGDGGSERISMCATKTIDDSYIGWAPFGLQNQPMRLNLVTQVILICKSWGYYYKIPVSDFMEFETTVKAGRRLFNVNLQHELSSSGTAERINLKKYQVPIGA